MKEKTPVSELISAIQAEIDQQSSKKPISDARRAANLANSRRSTGPRSEEGKRHSRLNACRSRLHGQVDCLPEEDFAEYQKLLGEVITEYKPSGPTERFYATNAAQAMWRLERAAAIEQGIFAKGYREKVNYIDSGHHQVDTALATSETFLETAKELSLLTTYENRIRRTLEKNLTALKQLQDQRKAKYERAVDDATALMQYAEFRGEVYDPGDDFKPPSAYGGFVFSAEALHRRLDRERRVNSARHWRFHGEDPNPMPQPEPKPGLAA